MLSVHEYDLAKRAVDLESEPPRVRPVASVEIAEGVRMEFGPTPEEGGEPLPVEYLDDLHVPTLARRARDDGGMRAVVQRVTGASVSVDGTVVGACGAGLLVLVGVADGDDEGTAERLAGKIARLRIFEDGAGRFDCSLLDTGGEALVVSQFTLLADTGKGNRPSFIAAARPEQAEPLYLRVCEALREQGVSVATGSFGTRMEVSLANDGPVTIVLDV